MALNTQDVEYIDHSTASQACAPTALMMTKGGKGSLAALGMNLATSLYRHHGSA